MNAVRDANFIPATAESILDFLSGYCVHNAGHNHSYIIQALKDEMDKRGPGMLQSHVPEIAGELARRLCQLAGGGLEKFISAAAAVKVWRPRLVFARHHGPRRDSLYEKQFSRTYSWRAFADERSLLAPGVWATSR